MEEASKIPSLPGKGSFSLGRQPRSKAERNGRKNQSSAGSQSEEEENKPDPVRPKRKEKKPEDERFLESFHRRELAGGILEVILVCAVCLCLPFFLLRFLYQLNVWAGLALEVFWCYQLIATKSLSSESMRVYRFLKSGSLRHARKAVSMIVGRDTERLDEEGVIKATVETIAENAADGVVAPMFFMAIGGIPLMFLYKGINTMDSMLGYKNEKYLYYGRCAAKVDDAANFLPSRLTGLLMVLAALISGFDGKNAWKIFRRDRYKHASPNSAQSEAAMAGALGIQLAGNAYYFGELYEKPTIGDPLRNISKNDIPLANRLLFVTAFLALLVFTLLYVLIH
ncbi:MAG: cobalamin biosynthesis protein CobD [Blautia sp.]|nr:cobalamin biosynthesis protein CobD [Blautia sp.]